jgi:nucleotidyltransferase AbiEii toxin of type IV toxin-antitoxin system
VTVYRDARGTTDRASQIVRGLASHGFQNSKEVAMNAFERLREIIQALNAEQVDYVLFGGQAVNLHGILRFTEDIDLFVSPTPENVQRLRQALGRIWQDPAIDEINAADLGGEYAVVRYGTPDGFALDLVSRIGEAFRFEDIESETLALGGDVRVRVATPRMLYRMKKETVRPIERADALDLKAKFLIEDE